MRAFISFKTTFLIFITSLAIACAAAFLLQFFLEGPKLGPIYDFFLKVRPQPAVSNEILVINTEEFVEGGDLFSVLMTLTELDAANLILHARVSPSSSPITGTETEIKQRFNDEYRLVGNNIRNLFEGIRTGSISPVNANGYVEQVVQLTEQGRDRLISALIDRDEDLIRAAAAFGNFYEDTETEQLRQTAPVLDWDGKIRRVNPSAEHPVYRSLKHRFLYSQVEFTGMGQVLSLHGQDGEKVIPLDKDGNILIAGHAAGFRRMDISQFREYEDANRAMYRALRDANELGAFSKTRPESSPFILGDYSLSLRDEMLNEPDERKRSEWIASRAGYFKSLDEFLYGSAEKVLIGGYEEVIADEAALQEDIDGLRMLRDKMINSFAVMRERYRTLNQLQSNLKKELESSFCIMGSSSAQNNAKNSVEYSALFANTLITGSHIKIAYERYVLILSFAAAFVILLIVLRMRPILLLIVACASSLLVSAAAGISFIYSSYWIEPVIVLGASLAASVSAFVFKSALLRFRARRFSGAYGAAVSDERLRYLIGAGKPLLSETITKDAVVVVVKDPELTGNIERKNLGEAIKQRKEFYSKVKKILFNEGAVIAGYERDLVIACFGSPLDNSLDPAVKACGFVEKLLEGGNSGWYFGMDTGNCAFFWSPETGYTVSGSPVVRARVLAAKTITCNVRSLITGALHGKIKKSAKRIGAFNNEGEFFYEFPCLDN